MAILSEAEVQVIKRRNVPFDPEKPGIVFQLAETCLAAMARADAAEGVMAKREKKEP